MYILFKKSKFVFTGFDITFLYKIHAFFFLCAWGITYFFYIYKFQNFDSRCSSERRIFDVILKAWEEGLCCMNDKKSFIRIF